MEDITKTYTNGEITIVWKPSVCIHSTVCWKGAGGLIDVFNPRERPWVKPYGAGTERIVAQIEKCPSGALSYYRDEEKKTAPATAQPIMAEAVPNGPLLVHGDIVVKDKNGSETPKNHTTAFCRCGASENKPYCDGSHSRIAFQG